MVRFAKVYRFLAGQGISIPIAEVKEAFSQIDQAALAAKVRERFRYQVWDGVSPVNGVPAERVRRAKGLASDQAAYLILVDGRAVILSGQHFRTGERLTADNVEQAAQEHLDALVEAALLEELTDEIMERL